MEDVTNAYKILLAGRDHLGDNGIDNAKMGLSEMGCENVERFHTAHVSFQLWALVNKVMHTRVL
jgi:hypothetical protein